MMGERVVMQEALFVGFSEGDAVSAVAQIENAEIVVRLGGDQRPGGGQAARRAF